MLTSFQGFLRKIKLKLTVFVDDQLRSRIENSGALALVGVVQVEFARSQVVFLTLGRVVGFAKRDLPVGGEANLPPGWGADQGT